MKSYFLFWVIVFSLAGCDNRAKELAEQIDLRFKDSIARVDGNKVLGNIQFGITQKEFDLQQELFLKEHHDTIYGYHIQKIKGLFTPEDQLYQVKFYGVDSLDHARKEYPFRDFLTEKFGPESFPNNWIVGDREISIERERRNMSYEYALLQHYNSFDELMAIYLADHNFYLMSFVSDSLYWANEIQLRIRTAQRNRVQEQERLREQQRAEERKRSDVQSL